MLKKTPTEQFFKAVLSIKCLVFSCFLKGSFILNIRILKMFLQFLKRLLNVVFSLSETLSLLSVFLCLVCVQIS